MVDAHDGPISQGIRDAIKASDKTPYAIAKQVTQRGKVKLTGPQIYRFIKGEKGLSLAVLDEIARLLDVTVQLAPQAPAAPVVIESPQSPPEPEPIVLVPEHVRLIGYIEGLSVVNGVATYDGIELRGDEDRDELLYVFNFNDEKVGEYMAGRRAERRAERRRRRYVRKPPNLGLCRTRDFVEPPPDAFQVRLNSLQLPEGFDETGIKGKINKLWERYYALVTEPELTPSEIERANARHEIERKRIFDEAPSWEPGETATSFQAKLDSLRLPDGFEEGETSWQPKAKRLEARYKALLGEIGSSPREKQLADARYKQEIDRIIKESEDTPEHEWFG